MKEIPAEIRVLYDDDALLVQKNSGGPISPRFTPHPDFDIPIRDFKAVNSLVVNWYMK